MASFRKYILFIFLLWSVGISAQSPCGSPPPPPTDDCGSACVLCDLSEINGYTGTSGSYTPDGSFSCGSTENDQWFAFMAASPFISLTVTPTGCSNGNGIQLAVFEGSCGGSEVGCSSPGIQTPTTVSFSAVVGQTYYVMIDGYGGDNCGFSVNAVGGGNVGVGNPAVPSGPVYMCANGNGTYSIPPVLGAGEYTWDVPAGATINGMPGPVTITGNAGTSIDVVFGPDPNGQVCVTPANACNTGITTCLTIIEKIIFPTVLPPVTICSFSQYTFIDGNSYSTDGTMTATLQTAEGCDSIVTQDLAVVQPVFVNLGLIKLCAGDCFFIGSSTYCSAGSYTEFMISSVYPYCDSIVSFDIEVVVPDAEITPITSTVLDCQNVSAEFIATGFNPYFDSTSYTWYNSYGAMLVQDQYFYTQDTGVYTLEVMVEVNGQLCVASNTVHVTENIVLPSVSWTASPLPCNGNTTIQMNLSDTNHIIYQWMGPGINTTNEDIQDPLVNVAGNYTLWITDTITMCSTSVFVQVFSANAPMVTINSVQNLNCYAQCQGSATASVSGGALPYVYQWNDVMSQQSQIATGLCSGSYTVTVTDANGCAATASVILTQPDSFSVSQALVNPHCNLNDGQACVQVSGATAPYTYAWNDPFNQADSCANSLFAGSYQVTIQDQNNCQVVHQVQLSNIQGPSASIVTNQIISCYGVCDGSLQVNVSGGNAPYIYQWNDPLNQTGSAISQLCAGTYAVTVTDASNCMLVAQETLITPDSFSFSTSSVNADCNVSNGQACVSLSGGTPPYTFQWDDVLAQTTSCANNVLPGSYQVVFQDAHFCIDSISVLVNSNNAPSGTVSVVQSNLCPSDCQGTFQVNAFGGVPPYTYLWDDPNAQSSNIASGLCNGIYSVEVRDVNGCVVVLQDTLTSPAALFTSTTSQQSNCSQATGQVCVIAGGGQAPYFYQWSDPAAQTTACALNLPQGNYYVTVTDANGCTRIDSAIVIEFSAPSILASLVQNTLCNYSCDGILGTIVNGGSLPYNYTWNDPLSQTGATANSLCPGTYQVTVTDAHHCQAYASAAVVAAPASSYQQTTINPNCNQADGQICLQVIGSATPYMYQWSNGDLDSCMNSVSAGVYQVTVTDANACQDTLTYTLTNLNAATVVSQTLRNATCYQDCNGVGVVRAFGGTPPYTYLWSDPFAQTNDTAFSLCAGNYQITLTEANGCNTINQITITEPARLSSSVAYTEELCVNACNGDITLNAQGGNGGYQYSVDSGISFQSQGYFDLLCGGMYYIKVIDDSLCVYQDSLLLTSGTFLVDAYIMPEDTICEGAGDIMLQALNPGGIWQGNGITNSATGLFSPLAAGIGSHQITYTTNVVCGETDTFTLVIKDQFDATIMPQGPLCENSDQVLIQTNETGGIWQGVGLVFPGPYFSPLIAGSGFHQITYSRPGYCGDAKSIMIDVQEVDSIHLTIDAICVNDPIITLSAFPGGYWTGPGVVGLNPGLFSPSFAGPGNHQIMFINPNSCLDTQYVPVHVYNIPELQMSVSDTSGCSPLEVNFNHPLPTSAIYTWLVDDHSIQGTQGSYIFDYPGAYDITLQAIDSNGCKSIHTWNNIIHVQDPSVADFGFELIEDFNQFEFFNHSTNALYYDWNFGSNDKNPVYEFKEGEDQFTFCLTTISIHGCKDSICHEYYIEPPFYVYVPNTFTPNGNQLNDLFYPVMSSYAINEFENYLFTVFNRWGDLVYRTQVPGQGWDGFYKGILSQQGVYTWKLSFVHQLSHQEIDRHGQVNLLKGE